MSEPNIKSQDNSLSLSLFDQPTRVWGFFWTNLLADLGDLRALLSFVDPRFLKATPNTGRKTIGQIQAIAWDGIDPVIWSQDQAQTGEICRWRLFNDRTCQKIEALWLAQIPIATISEALNTHRRSVVVDLRHAGWSNPEIGPDRAKRFRDFRSHHDRNPWLAPLLEDGMRDLRSLARRGPRGVGSKKR